MFDLDLNGAVAGLLVEALDGNRYLVLRGGDLAMVAGFRSAYGVRMEAGETLADLAPLVGRPVVFVICTQAAWSAAAGALATQRAAVPA